MSKARDPNENLFNLKRGLKEGLLSFHMNCAYESEQQPSYMRKFPEIYEESRQHFVPVTANSKNIEL